MRRLPMPAPRVRAALVGAVLAASTVVGIPAAVVTAAPPCQARVMATAVTYNTLQRAVANAPVGGNITVKGVCVGTTTIGKNVIIKGIKTATTGTPTLSGGDAVRVLKIKAGADVTFRNLTIRDGLAQLAGVYPDNSGAAMLLYGKATLRDVIVRDNVGSTTGDAGSGAIEVFEKATLTLAGATQVRNNQGRYGGGIENYGTLSMQDTATVHHNTASNGGGGIWAGGTEIGVDCSGSGNVQSNTPNDCES